jgi:hypothetical protein
VSIVKLECVVAHDVVEEVYKKAVWEFGWHGLWGGGPSILNCSEADIRSDVGVHVDGISSEEIIILWEIAKAFDLVQ